MQYLNNNDTRLWVLGALLLFMLLSLIPTNSEAIPVFARKYNMTCTTCHAAFPRLNEFGENFVKSNYRLPNWKDSTTQTGDDMLALPDNVPLAIRAQAYVQKREATNIDIFTGEEISANTDFQGPYLIKLLSSAPLSDHISYYFYAILAEKGANSEVIVEDAWFTHDDLFGSDVGMMLGQFQVSDLMFARETRLNFQDFMVYRMAGLTYDRGVNFSYDFNVVDLAIGWVNGNGITDNYGINSPGYKRPDHLFDNDNGKAFYGRLGGDAGPVNLGLFGYSGNQKNYISPVASGERDTSKLAYGIDLSGNVNSKVYWYFQAIWNQWDNFIDNNQRYDWFGGFAGVDYIYSPRWAFSFLYNYANAGDLKNTDTVYEGIDINSLTFTASYYFMRNIKGIIELNGDLLGVEEKTGTYWTGHLSSENYALVGFDAAF